MRDVQQELVKVVNRIEVCVFARFEPNFRPGDPKCSEFVFEAAFHG